MNPAFGRGRGRRQVLQLGNSSHSGGYLARHGYGSLKDEGRDRQETPDKAGLSRLVGAYSDSDPDSEPDDAPTPPHSAPVDVANELVKESSQSLVQQPLPQQTQQEVPVIDSEVASFLAEINAISTDETSMDHNDIPLPPGSFIPRDQTAEVLMERHKEREKPPPEEKPEPRPQKKSNNYSMFVKGGSETLGKKGGKYTSKFVKGGTETLKQEGNVKIPAQEEAYELPEAPSTVWQQCQDENTKYIYYWNFVSNEVTWNIPQEYTQYLLLQKEYEEQLARIPEDVRKRLEAIKQSQSKDSADHVNGKQDSKQQPGPETNSSQTSNAPEPRINSPKPESDNQNKKSKKSKITIGPSLPDKESSSEQIQEKTKGDKGKVSLSEVDLFVSDLLTTKPRDVGAGGDGRKTVQSKVESSKNGVSKSKTKDENDEVDMDFDIDDIDAALELALERKTGTSKESSTKESKHSKSKKHDRKDRDRKDRHDRHDKHEKHRSDSRRSDSHKSDSRPRELFDYKHKSDSRHKRSTHREGSQEKKEQVESQPKKARLVAAYDDDSEEETATSTTSTPAPQPSKSCLKTTGTSDSTDQSQSKEEPKARAVPSLIQIKEDIEDSANIALGKLEFLEVTKKGLSKLQVLLLELQTRFRDWQDGGLDSQYFLSRLKEANQTLEQYEASAVPPGYSCNWDRMCEHELIKVDNTMSMQRLCRGHTASKGRRLQWNFRRYFYTSDKTGESQWDYPEPSPVTTTSTPASTDQSEVSSSKEPALPTESPPSSPPQQPPPPPPPPDDNELSLAAAEPSEVVYGPDPCPPATAKQESGEADIDVSIDGEPMPPDSSEENAPDQDKPPEPDNSETSQPPVFPGEPPPPGTEVLFGRPPPPPPSDPYPGGDDTQYSVDHDSPDDADMDVDDPESPKSIEAEDSVSSSHQGYHVSTVQASSSEVSESVEATPVIYRPPQLNMAVSSSSSSTSTSSSTAVFASQPVISAQAVVASTAGVTSEVAATPSTSQVDMFAELPPPPTEEISSTSVTDIPPPLPPTSAEGEKTQKKEKKKKKDKSITSSSLSLKKKNVSSLVQKWQQVKVQVEEEEKVNEERQMAIRQKLEEWKREQGHS